VQGGISNGEHIVLRVAFKPTATIARRHSYFRARKLQRVQACF
jgi:chorismate synthase